MQDMKSKMAAKLSSAMKTFRGGERSPMRTRPSSMSLPLSLGGEKLPSASFIKGEEAGSELADLSGHSRSRTVDDVGGLDEIGRGKRVNEVADRLEEITRRMMEEEVVQKQKAAEAEAGVMGLSLVGGAHKYEDDRAHDDNASTTLSTAETTNDAFFWGDRRSSRDWTERDVRALLVNHVLEPGDTVSDCVKSARKKIS